MNGIEKLGARNRGSAAFHDYEAAGNVGDVSGFEWSGIAGKGESVGGEDGVSRAGDVDGLLTAVNRDVDGRAVIFEENHTIFAASDEKGTKLHVVESSRAAAFQFSKIFTNDGVMESFDFRFVGSGGSDGGAAEIGEAIARIQGNGSAVLQASGGGAHVGGIDYAKAIVGDGQGVGFGDFGKESGTKFLLITGSERLSGFVVHAEDLLADGVGPAGEEAGLGGGGPISRVNDLGSGNFLLTEDVDEVIAGVIAADSSDGDDLGAEGSEIAGGIGAAAGYDLRFAVAEDEDGSFARDAGDVTVLEGVGDKIAEDENSFGGKAIDDVGEGEDVDGGRGGIRFYLFGGDALHRMASGRRDIESG